MNNVTYKKTLAIDFDGVIHAYRNGWRGGEIYDIPIDGSFDALADLIKTYRIFIHTSRDPNTVIDWLRINDPHKQQTYEVVPDNLTFWNKDDVIGITNRKIPAVAYIDDRGIRFTNWRDMLNLFS